MNPYPNTQKLDTKYLRKEGKHSKDGKEERRKADLLRT